MLCLSRDLLYLGVGRVEQGLALSGVKVFTSSRFHTLLPSHPEVKQVRRFTVG